MLPGGRTLSQTAAVLDYLAPRLGLAGALGSRALAPELEPDERVRADEERATVNQLVLTVLDWLVEVRGPQCGMRC